MAPVLAWGPGSLVDALKAESSLWRQEADLYKRKASEALSEATGVGVAAGSGSAEADAAAAGLSLDAAFAAVLLDAPLRALQQGGGSSSGTAAATAAAQGSSSGTEAAAAAAQGMPTAPALPVLDRALYERDAAALAQQELPYYRQARACGHCGEQAGSPTALADRAWFDFRSYTSYKALARQLGPELSAAAAGAAPTTLTGMERMHAGSPEMQLRAAEQAWLASGQRASPFGPGSLGAGSGQGPEEQLAAAAAAYRATGRPLPGSTVPPPLSAADALRLAVGGVLLRHAESDLAAAAAAGDQASAAAAAAVASTSPELDSIRAGVQALLAYFVGKGAKEEGSRYGVLGAGQAAWQRPAACAQPWPPGHRRASAVAGAGYAAAASCEQLGLSLDEYEVTAWRPALFSCRRRLPCPARLPAHRLLRLCTARLLRRLEK